MTATPRQLHLAVALDGAGWHPAAWREADARPAELLLAGYWTDLVAEAEWAMLDFVTIEDSFAPADSAEGGTAGRLDAVLIAARVGPVTRSIGLIPTVTVTHTEPFHTSKAIATLDYVTAGRAGLHVRVSARPAEAALFGRRSFTGPAAPHVKADLLDEAADYVEVVRRLWDSWEDDAEIRDAATGRFVDRDRLHYIDFAGRWFSVKGPSITPRPPQGQPVVTALASDPVGLRSAARSADIAFVTPQHKAQAAALVAQIRAATGRAKEPVRVFADLLVFLDADQSTAAARRVRLDGLAGRRYQSDALTFTGRPAQLADLMAEWQRSGLSGFRLRPAAVPHDLIQITTGLVPELQRRGQFRLAAEPGTLRGLLNLPRPGSRYRVA